MIASPQIDQKPWLASNWPKRLQYILHLGLVEIRKLAAGGHSAQIHELADALEILPQFIDSCDEEKYELVRYVLTKYQEQYHSNFDFPARLQQDDPPERY